MSEQDSKKQTDTEFICKLCDMIQKFPSIINWTTDGQKMIIFDIRRMEQRVLPEYFRHSNFPSFIRQLNMYDFHKLQKNQNEIIFRNNFFVKGNEKNFHFIQRKKRIKEQSLQSKEFYKKTQPILKRLESQPKIQEETKDAIQSLLEFKYTAYENTKKIRHDLDTIAKQLKDCRSKKITETVKTIKNNLIEAMTEQLKFSKDIDLMLENKFLVEKEKEKEKENKELLSNLGHFVGSQFHLPIFNSDKMGSKEMFFDYNHMRSRPSFVALPSNCGFWSIKDINNLQSIYFSAPKIISQMNYGSERNYADESMTKKQRQSDEQEDSLSMGMIGEKELEEILKGQDKKSEGHTQGKGLKANCL